MQVWNFKKEDTFNYDVQLSDFQDLPRSSRNLSWKTTHCHEKTHRQPLFTGSYLTGPCPTSREICDTLKKISQVSQGHRDHRKPTLGATSNVRGKIDESKEIVQEIQQMFSSQGITFAHTVFLAHCEFICKFGTLRKKTRSATTCNSRISKIFPGRAGILVGK